MGKEKKKIRDNFRTAVFKRDKYQCRVCENIPKSNEQPLDAHHITDRTLMPSGGYVADNGISLCGSCHLKAEAFHITGVALEGFSPDDLYKLIESSYEKAYEQCLKL